MPNSAISHSKPDILGQEQIDLTRLKKQAQLTQTSIPKTPRITRTLKTLESVLKVLEEHSRKCKHHIDQLIQSVANENHQLARQLHECQVAYLKLQAHTASLQSLKECYCRYAHMLDGARTMFNAFQQTSTKRDSIDQVKLGLKECTQTLCAIEAQLEAMLGTFVLNLQEISGFSRICPGDEYEVVVRYGLQKWKTRGRIRKQDRHEQVWTRQIFHLKAKLADLLLIKINEVKLLGVSLKTIGTKCFEVNNFYSIEPQRMIINANQSGTIKLIFLVHWDLYDQVDTKFTFYNPNRTYNDVTRTWSMFVGNTTLLRTVNDTLSFSSASSSSASHHRLSTFCPLNSVEDNAEYLAYTPSTDDSNHYDEINLDSKSDDRPKDEASDRQLAVESGAAHDETRSSSYSSSSFAAGLNSDELSSATSNEYCHADGDDEEAEEENEHESIYELDLLIEQVRTCLDDLRLIDRSFPNVLERIEQTVNDLDRRIKLQIHEQTETTLEIETILGDFNFLDAIDDEDTSKTIDSGFEGEQQIKHNESFPTNNNQVMNVIFVDVLNRILILLHYIQNRSKSDDALVLERLNEQHEQLNMAIAWSQNQVQNVQQVLSQCDPTVAEFWSTSCSKDALTVSYERCLHELTKLLNCSEAAMECLLNNLSCLAFRTNPSSPRSLSLIQIWFLLRKDRETLLNEIQSAAEQINHSTDLSNLLENQNYPQIASILNARTLNNEKLFDRILDEYQFKIPDELIGLLLPSIRHDLIAHLRTALLSHHDNPGKRLQIHKMIFHVQQVDSL